VSALTLKSPTTLDTRALRCMFDLCQSKAVSAPDLVHALKSCLADGEAINPENGNTPLHSLCLNERCSLRMLHTYLDLSPGAAAVRNSRGQWAMHQLVTNPSMTAEMAAVLLLHTPLATAEDACDASGSTFLHAWINFSACVEVPVLAAILDGGSPGLGLQLDAQGNSSLALLAASRHCTEELLACYLQYCPVVEVGCHMWEALKALANNSHALSSSAMSLLLRYSKEPATNAIIERNLNPLAGLMLNPRLTPDILGMYLDRYSSHGAAPVPWDGASFRRPRDGQKAPHENSGGTALHLMARKCLVPLSPAIVETYVTRCPEALDMLDHHHISAISYLASRADASAELLLATATAPPSSSPASEFSSQRISNLLSSTSQLKGALTDIAEPSHVQLLPSPTRDDATIEATKKERGSARQAPIYDGENVATSTRCKLRVHSSSSAKIAVI